MLREGKYDGQGREQGEWKEFYESGHQKSIGNYVDGKREGLWKFSHENDSLEQIGTYVKGKPSGSWKWYYPNGALRREAYLGHSVLMESGKDWKPHPGRLERRRPGP